MSPPEPTHEPTTEAPSEVAAEPARRRRSRKRRWAIFLAKLLGYAALLLLVLRLSAPLYLPSVLSASANQLGFELTYEDLDLGLLDGTFTAHGVQLLPIEGGEPIATVERVDAKVDLQALREGRMIYEQVTITGLDGVLVVDEDGVLQLQKRVEHALYGDGPRPKTSGNDEFLIYEHMVVQDSQIRWIDRSVTPPVDQVIRVALTARDWNSIKAPHWPEQLDATLGSPARPQAASLTSTYDGDQTTIRLRVQGLDPLAVEGYVRDAGWAPTATSLDLDVGWRTRAGTPQAPRDLRLEDIRMAADGREVLTLNLGHMTPTRLEKKKKKASKKKEASQKILDLGTVELSGLKIQLIREADGRTTWSSFERVPPPGKPEEGGTTVQGIRIEGSHVRFHDRALSPPHDVAFGVRELTLGASDGGPARAVPFKAELFVPHGAGSIALIGSYTDLSGGSAVSAHVDARRATGRALAPYLAPYGLEPTLKDGRFQADVEVGQVPLEGGAVRPWLRLRGLELSSPHGPPLRCDALVVEGRRVDEAARDRRYASIRLLGLEAEVTRRPGGVLDLPGARLVPLEGQPSEPSRFETGELSLQVRRLKINTPARPEVPPIVLRDVRAKSVGPLILDGLGKEAAPSFELDVRGEIAPLASRCTVLAHVKRPLKDRVHTELEVTLDGLRGQGLLDLAEANPRWRVDTLRDGVLEAGISFDRRPTASGEPGATWSVEVHGARLRTRPGAPPVATLDQALLEIARLDRSTGAFEATSLELVGPRLSLRRSQDGLHTLGLLQVPPPDDPVSEPPAPPPADAANGWTLGVLQIANGQLDYRDVRAQPHANIPVRGIDLEVSGLSQRALYQPSPVRFRGTAAAGTVALPWRRLDPKGTKRSAVLEWLTFGQIKRPVEDRADLDARPAFADIEVEGSLVLAPHPRGTGRLELHGLELPIFRGIAEQNDVKLRHGRLNVSTQATFLGDGRTRLESELLFYKLVVEEPLGGVVGSTIGVPLTPLSAVVKVLEDDRGVIRVPITVTLDHEGLISKKTYRVVLEALPAAVGNRLKNVPEATLKSLGKTVVGVVPKPLRELFEGEEEVPLLPVRLQFAPGSAHLEASERAKLHEVARLLKRGGRVELRLEHSLSQDDIDRVEKRVNPSEQELRAMLRELERRRRELLTERAQGHARAEAALDADDPNALERAALGVRELDVWIGALELARDRVWTLLDERSRWDTRRRTREGARDLAELRMGSVRDALLGYGLPNLSARLHTRPPVFHVDPEEKTGGVQVIPTLKRE